jgi:hypothetical protein
LPCSFQWLAAATSHFILPPIRFILSLFPCRRNETTTIRSPYPSSLILSYCLLSFLMMHIQAFSRALPDISVLPASHAVRFEAACTLSSTLVLVAVIRACAHFQLEARRLSQLAISALFISSCASLLGVISSKVSGITNFPALWILS